MNYVIPVVRTKKLLGVYARCSYVCIICICRPTYIHVLVYV